MDEQWGQSQAWKAKELFQDGKTEDFKILKVAKV